jgi:hypothetical protein
MKTEKEQMSKNKIYFKFNHYINRLFTKKSKLEHIVPVPEENIFKPNREGFNLDVGFVLDKDNRAH